MELDLVFTVMWAAWIAAFLAIEIPALIQRRRGDTLTDHVMWFQRLRVGRVPIGWILFGAFWTWLTTHFVTGWI